MFSDVWTILRYLVCKEGLCDGKYKIDFDSASNAYVNLYNDIRYILTHREQMKQELLDIFNISSEYKVKLPTSEIALIYQAYNQNRGYDLILNELNPYIKDAENQLLNSWEDIIKILRFCGAPGSGPGADDAANGSGRTGSAVGGSLDRKSVV